MLKRLKGRFFKYLSGNYKLLDKIYVPIDKQFIRRTKNIRLIPTEENRRGGKYSYAEWAHVIGIFQTIIFQQLDNKTDNSILDIGCGTGLLGIACEPFIGNSGLYIGLDVNRNDISFCQEHYVAENYVFIHHPIHNPVFSPKSKVKAKIWPIENESIDLVTALSVWTHLNKDDAQYYFREIQRVLKPGGKAIVTFFLLDDVYEKSLIERSTRLGKYHMTAKNIWIFDQQSYGSGDWLHPKWAKVPETAIGVTENGVQQLVRESGLKIFDYFQGNWKEVPGIFFQDIFVFEKSK